MFETNGQLIETLKLKSSDSLKEFSQKIIPTKYSEIIGVKIPELRKIAKECAKEDFYNFLNVLSDKYFEEIMLRGMAIGYADLPYRERIKYIDDYLVLADNWAHIDSVVSTYKFIVKNKESFWKEVLKHLQSKHVYGVRFSLVVMLVYYIEEGYLDKIFNAVDSLNLEEYYVSMAAAWLLSVCYVKFPKETENYLVNAKIDNLTYNRTVQKICDSYRVDKQNKEKMKKSKRKI